MSASMPSVALKRPRLGGSGEYRLVDGAVLVATEWHDEDLEDPERPVLEAIGGLRQQRLRRALEEQGEAGPGSLWGDLLRPRLDQ